MRIHATDLLEEDYQPAPVIVLFGDEHFLIHKSLERWRELILGHEEGEFSERRFDGRSANWNQVKDELATRSMFGASQRVVIIDPAEDFIKNHRAQLEQYVAAPKPTAVLLLLTNTWQSNTKLAKAVDNAGIAVECKAPAKAKFPLWLGKWSEKQYGKKIERQAVLLLLELVGPELGLLDQELNKLAAYAGEHQRITEAMVSQLVGGWRTRTTWEMLDAATAGDAAKALHQLDRLLAAGEQPIGILAQISYVLRRYAAAGWLIVRSEKQGKKLPVTSALQQVGIRSFALEKSKQQLARLGRVRAAQLYRWLVDTDSGLKGDSALPPRVVLEKLLVQIAAPHPQQPAK